MKNKKQIVKIGDTVKFNMKKTPDCIIEYMGDGPLVVQDIRTSPRFIKGQNSPVDFLIHGKWANGYWFS